MNCILWLKHLCVPKKCTVNFGWECKRDIVERLKLNFILILIIMKFEMDMFIVNFQITKNYSSRTSFKKYTKRMLDQYSIESFWKVNYFWWFYNHSIVSLNMILQTNQKQVLRSRESKFLGRKIKSNKIKYEQSHKA